MGRPSATCRTRSRTMIRDVFREVMGVELAEPFPRMTYAEAMRRYGSDKPDLRIALEFIDVAELVKNCEFKVFTDWANHADGRVVALRAPGGAALSRKQIDDYAAHAAKYGAKGLAWMKIEDRGEGPRRHQFADREVPRRRDARRDRRRRPARRPATLIFFGAGHVQVRVSDFMGALRLKLGKDLGLVADGWAPLWVTDFPMFEWDDEEKRYVALHHPFTAPAVDDDRRPAREREDRGRRAATTWCSTATRSAAVRSASTTRQMQSAVFDLLGIGAEEARRQVRLPARRAEVRRAAARRHRVRHRPHRRADGRHRIDPRRHRVPEDHHRAVPDDRRAVAGAGRAAGRSARAGASEKAGRSERGRQPMHAAIRRATSADAARAVGASPSARSPSTLRAPVPAGRTCAIPARQLFRRGATRGILADPDVRDCGSARTATATRSVTRSPVARARLPHPEVAPRRRRTQAPLPVAQAQNGGLGASCSRPRSTGCERDGPRTLVDRRVVGELRRAALLRRLRTSTKVGEYEFLVGTTCAIHEIHACVPRSMPHARHDPTRRPAARHLWMPGMAMQLAPAPAGGGLHAGDLRLPQRRRRPRDRPCRADRAPAREATTAHRRRTAWAA